MIVGVCHCVRPPGKREDCERGGEARECRHGPASHCTCAPFQSFELFSLLVLMYGVDCFFLKPKNATFLKVDNEFEDSGDNAWGKRHIHLTTLQEGNFQLPSSW